MATGKISEKKLRKGPTESATNFNIGTKKKGNDGNMWIIIATSSGTHRWKKISKTKKSIKASTKKKSTKKKSTKKKSTKKKSIEKKSADISVETLKQLKKKYSVTTPGSKKEMAEGLWRVRGSAMDSKDLALIVYLLPKKQQKEVEKLLDTRNNNPITNYKGMWKPLPKPLSKMTREELIRNLRSFRNAWEKITTRNQDLSNERLAKETTEDLRQLIKFFYSNNAKNLATSWLH
jgi:hypothetical protein